MKTQEERELEIKLKGVMEFYISTYFDYYKSKIKDEVAKHNVYVETDIMEARIDDHINGIVEEVAEKFHTVCTIILDTIASGREQEVREFELLFVDLLKRTLAKRDMEGRGATPIIIVTEPQEQERYKEN
jgi:hypothetical protein